MKYIDFLIIFLLLVVITVQSLSKTTTVSSNNSAEYEQRLLRLEPKEPKLFYDYQLLPERDLSKFLKNQYPIKEAIDKGNDVTFETVYHDSAWKRPAYHPDWHSTNLRWSNIPLHLANQQHRLYIYQGGGSWWYDLSEYLVLPPSSYFPSPINKFAFTIKYPFVTRIIVMNATVKTMKYYRNQIILLVEPGRTGLHLIDFDHKKLQNKSFLLQMSTISGEELDYLILNTSS